MDGYSRGGNDSLTGGAGGFNTPNGLLGDANTMDGNSRGGNDTLTGGANATNFLFGDAVTMNGNARGGDDTLISGTGTDHMWGDARLINGVVASPTADTGTVVTGADTFVFAPGNGNDDINDFRQSDGDKIDVSAYGVHSLADMLITSTGTDTRIAFDATNSVTLVGLNDPNTLHGSDFIFA
jgi:serralysin